MISNTTMHAFHSTPLVVKRSAYSPVHLDVHMLNGLPNYDGQADAAQLPRGDWYNDFRKHRADRDMATASVCIGSLSLRNTDLEEFIAAFKTVAADNDRLVRVERFVKLPFPSPLPWMTTTVYEPELRGRWGSLVLAEGVSMSIGSDPVIFVEGC